MNEKNNFSYCPVKGVSRLHILPIVLQINPLLNWVHYKVIRRYKP